MTKRTINIRPFFGKGKMKLKIEHDPSKNLPHDHIWVISSTGKRLCYLHLDDSFLSIETIKGPPEGSYFSFTTERIS